MDAFEQLVSEILWMSGFWVRTSVKVKLTKEEKRLIRRGNISGFVKGNFNDRDRGAYRVPPSREMISKQARVT